MTATRHERFPVASVSVPERIRRHVDAEKVKALADSIARIGLMTPITVYIGDTGPILVAGHHRLLAVKQLGSYDIPCIVTSAPQTERRMWEIAENLHRSELTDLERSEHMAEWLRLSAKAAQVGHPAQPHDKGISAAARELGVSRQQVQRAVKIDAITPEAKAAAKETGFANNQSALLRVAKAQEAEQVAEVQRIASERRPRPSNERRVLDPEERAHEERVSTLATYIVDRIQCRPKDLKEISLNVACDALSRARELFANYDVELG